MTSYISIMPAFAALTLASGVALAADSAQTVKDSEIDRQRAALAMSTFGAGFGPQSPRDIDMVEGQNLRVFSAAPPATEMNLCNIHFHENAEHRGGEFTSYAGNGDGKGYGTGYQYDGTLSEAELAPLDSPIGAEGGHGDLQPGDTIEVHYVHTTAQVTPGPTLGACLSEAIKNPQLRVEAQVYVLVNDENAADFTELTRLTVRNNLYQAQNIPANSGTPISYAGSTTGPGYNTTGSPFQVTWSVRPKVIRVNIHSVGTWLEHNYFNETHAHGVRNLVTNPDLLAPISN
ncbi:MULTISPECIES: delta-class carbonic anhydrase [unclassified Phaeobacter]|uniref:delta-class carbonic anhydrase n=1 Tax=unclassified Phaeobacter TaxID=2621772 RepID=UPI003A874904